METHHHQPTRSLPLLMSVKEGFFFLFLFFLGEPSLCPYLYFFLQQPPHNSADSGALLISAEPQADVSTDNLKK